MGKKILFACDLDNTLIYSAKKSSEGDICVEYINGVKQSFMTPETVRLMKKLTHREDIIFLPLTTRSVEQYKRIGWAEGCEPEYALAANGGVLIHRGEVQKEWYERSLDRVKSFNGELERLKNMCLERGSFTSVRIVEGLFLFVGCEDIPAAQVFEQRLSEETSLEVKRTGRKLYIFPPDSDKGTALERARDFFKADRAYAAGDSELDIPMLDRADVAILPDMGLYDSVKCRKKLLCGDERFSEFALRKVFCNKV
jgi:hydroxymethylpyrimidine pyrophosphatase-like HAD family hydrolase